jgi:hypothetical protein
MFNTPNYLFSIKSAAISFDSTLPSLANDADHEGVLAATNAKGDAAEQSSEEEECDAPGICHISCHFFGETLGDSHTIWTCNSVVGAVALVVDRLIALSPATESLIGVWRRWW